MNNHIVRSLVVLLASVCVAACSTTPTPGADENARTSADRFKVKVVSEAEEIRLVLHARGLSPAQSVALEAFSQTWRESDGRSIMIQAPNAARDPAAAYRMSESTKAFLIDQGLPENKIEVSGYDAAGDTAAPLIVGYLRYKAEIPECGKNWTNIARSMKNKAQANFGCAVTANMAAQIANPGDLLSPRDMTPQDAARRQVVLDKYRTGEKTGAEADESASGAVSKAVN